MTYESMFKTYTNKYFKDQDENFYLQFMAQGVAESNLNANAKSAVGAQGIMQIMPKTFKELCKKNHITNASPYTPEISIQLGISYDKTLYDEQSGKRPHQDRMAFMFASYNAGLGTILNAQKFCIKNRPDLNPNLQDSIEIVAEDVPTWKHEETLQYVKRIRDVHSKYIDKLKK